MKNNISHTSSMKGTFVSSFASFLSEFPAVDGETCAISGRDLAADIEAAFGVVVPNLIVDFWTRVGVGYFANRELFFFGSESNVFGHDSLVAWNNKNFWRTIFQPPIEGGPLFFAETCFGMQIGFVWKDDTVTVCLLDVDTLAMYLVANSCEELFASVLNNRFVFTEAELLAEVRLRLGPQTFGQHYAPIVSPLVGGSLTPDNHHIESPNVHLRTAITTWESLQ